MSRDSFELSKVTLSDGDNPSGTIAGTDITFEPYRTPDGTPTTIRNAQFGMAPEFKPGKSSGQVKMFGDRDRAFVAITAGSRAACIYGGPYGRIARCHSIASPWRRLRAMHR
jgi:hypothetical protein